MFTPPYSMSLYCDEKYGKLANDSYSYNRKYVRPLFPKVKWLLPYFDTKYCCNGH